MHVDLSPIRVITMGSVALLLFGFYYLYPKAIMASVPGAPSLRTILSWLPLARWRVRYPWGFYPGAVLAVVVAGCAFWGGLAGAADDALSVHTLLSRVGVGAVPVPVERIYPFFDGQDFIERCQLILGQEIGTPPHCRAVLSHVEMKYSFDEYQRLQEGYHSEGSLSPELRAMLRSADRF